MRKKRKANKNKVGLDPKDFIKAYLRELTRCLALLDNKKIELVISILLHAYKNNKKVFILGNGGSASTASHMACDLGKGTLQSVYNKDEKRFRVISLVDNTALMTALANDLSFDDIFVQQLQNLIEKDDVVLVLSGSGNSPNVIKAIKYAKTRKAITIGILGCRKGGRAGKLVDHSIVIDSNFYGPVEDIQLVINHIITAWVAKTKNIHDGKPGVENKNKAVPFK